MSNQKAFSFAPVAFSFLSTVLALSHTFVIADEIVETSAGRQAIYTIDADGRVTASVPANIPDDLSFAKFKKWIQRYAAASVDKKSELEASGIKLAKIRSLALVDVIKRDPQRALELALTPEERKALPASVKNHVEIPVRGRGEYRLWWQCNYTTATGKIAAPKPTAAVIDKNTPVLDHKATGETHQDTLQRMLTVGGTVYTPYVYGHRAGLSSKNKLPFHGIAVNDVMALHESPVKLLEAGEALPLGVKLGKDGTRSPISGKDAAKGIVGIVGSTAYYFETQQDVEKFTQRLWEIENQVGPNQHG